MLFIKFSVVHRLEALQKAIYLLPFFVVAAVCGTIHNNRGARRREIFRSIARIKSMVFLFM